MNVLIFLDELYNKDEKFYYSKFNAGNFLCELSNTYNLKFAVPVSTQIEKHKNTQIEESKVIDLGEWDSLISYLKNYFTHNKNIRKRLDKEIENSDIVWLRYPSIPGIKIAKLCIKKDKPMIIHVAGDISKAYENKKYSGIKKIVAYILGIYMKKQTYNILKNKNAKVTFLCTGSKLEKDFKKDDTQFFIDNELNPDFNHEKINKNKKFLYVGRLVEEKGIKMLVDSWNKINRDIELNIVGHGKLDQYIEKAAKDNSNIKYHGFKGGDELKKLYKDCDCLIMPSITSEGFPRVITEAWCNGLNVISSDVGGIKGIGKDLENLLLFNPGDEIDMIEKIRLIVDDATINEKLSENINTTAQYVSKDNMINIIKSNIEKYRK